MESTVFFRLLKTPIDDKGARLAAQIAALNETGQAEETYTLDPADFSLIPGSPFAYWVSDSVRQLFIKLPQVGKPKDVRQGLITAFCLPALVSHRDTEDTEETQENLRALCASVADPYPLSIAWDSILVDDPTHPSDVVARVREVLSLLWGDRAGAIEREACQILGVDSLRDYFRDPRRGFFPFHIKRYSKSRRKAPIYWLLQSEKRNYAI